MIMSGELPAGSQIREEQLAESCGVSRTPVRDALRRLEAEHFVLRSESQRSFVAEWSRDDVEDAFELRSMLEAHAARRAAIRINTGQIQKLKQYNNNIFEAISSSTPDVPRFLENNRHFHDIIQTAAGSDRLSGMLTTVTEQPVVLRTALQYDRESLMRAYHEHAELIAAFERHDADWAAAVMTGHIRRALHAYIDAVNRGSNNQQTNIAA